MWKLEKDKKDELHSLYHLTADNLYPDNFYKMHVGSAVWFFSVTTASALKLAVENELHEDALTTAWFLQKVAKWFEVVSSRHLKTSITKKNKEWRYFILDNMLKLSQRIEVRGSVWKPLNMGMILFAVSQRDICEFLFANNFHYLMLSRFIQDALENVFGQLRRRNGKTQTALECRWGMKLITISQFLSKGSV